MVPVITKMEVYPVAGHDCMELNLSGAHAPSMIIFGCSKKLDLIIWRD